MSFYIQKVNKEDVRYLTNTKTLKVATYCSDKNNITTV